MKAHGVGVVGRPPTLLVRGDVVHAHFLVDPQPQVDPQGPRRLRRHLQGHLEGQMRPGLDVDDIPPGGHVREGEAPVPLGLGFALLADLAAQAELGTAQGVAGRILDRPLDGHTLSPGDGGAEEQAARAGQEGPRVARPPGGQPVASA